MARVKVHAVCMRPLSDCDCEELDEPFAKAIIDAGGEPEPDGSDAPGAA